MKRCQPRVGRTLLSVVALRPPQRFLNLSNCDGFICFSAEGPAYKPGLQPLNLFLLFTQGLALGCYIAGLSALKSKKDRGGVKRFLSGGGLIVRRGLGRRDAHASS